MGDGGGVSRQGGSRSAREGDTRPRAGRSGPSGALVRRGRWWRQRCLGGRQPSSGGRVAPPAQLAGGAGRGAAGRGAEEEDCKRRRIEDELE